MLSKPTAILISWFSREAESTWPLLSGEQRVFGHKTEGPFDKTRLPQVPYNISMALSPLQHGLKHEVIILYHLHSYRR